MKLEPLVPRRHLDEILRIEEDLFGPERWSAAMFHSELDSGHYYLVAVDDEDGSVLGYGGLAVLIDEGWINNLGVRRDAQRRGVGRTLLRALLDEAERRGARRVMLEVAADNAAAQKLYASFGFEPVGIRRRYYQPSNRDALVMLREG